MMSDKITGVLVKRYMLDIKKELFRKSIHLCSAFVPFFLGIAYTPVLILLTCCLCLYCVFEFLRLKGKKIPFISVITEAAARKRDENKFVLGPVTLVLGIIFSALLWNPQAASIGIYALAFGDGLASLVGKLAGTVAIPFTHGKTVAGSLACFAAIFCSTFLVIHCVVFAFIIALIGMLIEVLPLKDFDNVLIPVLIGGIAQFL